MLCAGLTLTVEASPPGAQICKQVCLLLEDVADFGYILIFYLLSNNQTV